MSSVLADVGVTENEGVYTINQKAKEELNNLNTQLTNSISEYEEIINDGSIFRNALKNVGAFSNEVDNIYKNHTE
jgi:NADH:ubiquinone oxidoreductase subunit D